MGRWGGGKVGRWEEVRGSGEGREAKRREGPREEEGRGAKVLHTYRHTYIQTYKTL